MPSKKHNYLLLFLFGLVFIFLCARAVLVDMTHDEAYSFLNIKHFWYAQFLCNANSHWINSFGMWISAVLGFESPWQLRWLSLVSSLGILIIAYYWIRRFDPLPVKLFAFALAVLNPFVLDYFILARGYVSGMVLEILALLFFISYPETKKRTYTLLALFFSGLSAIANFNFFYFHIAFLVVYFSTLHFNKDLSFLKCKRFYLDALISLGFILLVLRALLFIRRCSNDFALGGTNFIQCLFSSYIDGLLGGSERYSELDAFGWILFLIVLSSIGYGILFFKKHSSKIYFYSSVIYSIYLFLLLFNHLSFGVLFPYYRSTLPMFPLLIINLICFFYFLLQHSKIQTAFFSVLALSLILNFLFNISFHHTIDFIHQSDSKASFDLVESLDAKKVGLAHEHEGVYINYYQATDLYKYQFEGKKLNTYDPDPNWIEKDKLEDFDFLILYPPYNLSYYKKRKIGFEGITIFPITRTVILKVVK